MPRQQQCLQVREQPHRRLLIDEWVLHLLLLPLLLS
jgi:hypothetical protein